MKKDIYEPLVHMLTLKISTLANTLGHIKVIEIMSAVIFLLLEIISRRRIRHKTRLTDNVVCIYRV